MELRLEDISGQYDNFVITVWHAAKGQRVSEGQELLEISTDKATFDVPSPCCGMIEEIYKRPGDSVGADETVAVIKEAARTLPDRSDI
jgi:pyruvate/2-oxoglutarate dehydrogenase complex dihydrolipoamide acyltransferase (E2) component